MRQPAAKEALQLLLERALLEPDGLSLWEAIRQSCIEVTHALECVLYVYDRQRGLLQRLEQDVAAKYPRRGPYRLGNPMSDTADHPAAQAIRESEIVRRHDGILEVMSDFAFENDQADSLAVFAVPIPDPISAVRDGAPIAVVVLEFPANKRSSAHSAIKRLLIGDLLDYLGLVGTHANLRRRLEHAGVMRHLKMDKVVDVVLDTLCYQLGFSFATISLVDEYPPSSPRGGVPPRQIRTERGMNVRGDRVWHASHSVDSNDIQADVLRTGRIEILSDWDERFDEKIYRQYGHENYIRVFAPLGRVGAIEAGFRKDEQPEIEPRLIDILRRWAYDVTVAVQNARLYERSQRRAESLAKLRQFHRDLLALSMPRDRNVVLEMIAKGALDVLRADLALLYWTTRCDPPDQGEQEFLGPIWAGNLKGSHKLKPPTHPGNIVSHIAMSGKSYLQTEARDDPLLSGAGFEGEGYPTSRTFTERQNIWSFAGVPLVAGDRVLGVLCLNYHDRRLFGHYYEELIELFAQEAADAITSDETWQELVRVHDELVRTHERRVVARAMHDDVKTHVRIMIERAKEAVACLADDPQWTRYNLTKIQEVGWEAIDEIRSIVQKLSKEEIDSVPIDQLVEGERRRFVTRDGPSVTVCVDEGTPPVPGPLQELVSRFVREAIANAKRYANATAIDVRASSLDGKLRLAVSDNGEGFNTQTTGPDTYGLTSMRDRVEELPGGEFGITSSVGIGTTVWTVVPVEASSKE